MFAKLKNSLTSCPVRFHLWRGVAGFLLIALGFYVFVALSVPGGVVLVLLSALFLRGCPLCWSFWLYEAVRDKKRRKTETSRSS